MFPDFSDTGVLPPFINGDPAAPSCRSPYATTIFEVVEKLCTSKHRANLLLGLNNYRQHLFQGGFKSGFQWIDGSFVENVEKTRGRPPQDIDVLTFFNRPLEFQNSASSWSFAFENRLFSEYFDTKRIKPKFNCDSYPLDLDSGTRDIVRNVTYWSGLFSDIRDSKEKKGILEVPLATDPNEFDLVRIEVGAKFDV